MADDQPTFAVGVSEDLSGVWTEYLQRAHVLRLQAATDPRLADLDPAHSTAIQQLVRAFAGDGGEYIPIPGVDYQAGGEW
jgi:hypothetical protein